MTSDYVKKLTGKKFLAILWNALYKDLYIRKKELKKAMLAGEKIFGSHFIKNMMYGSHRGCELCNKTIA
jgi:hypothetical protein